ncbi:PRC-barrel domain-containing protein [Cytobacillus horneckiae]|uniref:Photosystem reaction center subunit H n=1 Tax=Cytobacillus horneckiae TaxID=549687 RepID=A0A2N0ZI94_9BACI|nr:PRC-barrel domain-containing protein [Cytobacillus horneckiae]NRG46846.1 PRC-barrel domain-containing protein [Bacillus sp. CRN 9]MCM3179841.1 PRC-barrel domain-containing protein [Cytobacillus horneckiae]MEC1155230.1 PRC-barrel domain-containing protein [Cytobacillus horneckiae]MED2936717.1 PRC-barrel domain-containing protein [Cytobacillus horneckiae]PKG29214.1 photosystem reaction center subunit H [Cytobacillus horneckiae]
MRTFSLLKGLSVIEVDSGNCLGEVCDLSISHDGLVKGLLVKTGSFFKKTYFLDINDVSSFGWDGVMIPKGSIMHPLTKDQTFTVAGENRLAGKMMMTREGDRLGLLEDVYFHEEVGTIVGYELSDGFFSDVLEGKKVVKTEEPPAIGKDAIIVNVK